MFHFSNSPDIPFLILTKNLPTVFITMTCLKISINRYIFCPIYLSKTMVEGVEQGTKQDFRGQEHLFPRMFLIWLCYCFCNVYLIVIERILSVQIVILFGVNILVFGCLKKAVVSAPFSPFTAKSSSNQPTQTPFTFMSTPIHH